LPVTIIPLAVAMVEPSLVTLLMAAVGVAPLAAPSGAAAGGAAVAVSAVTMRTDPEHGVTAGTKTNALQKNYFAVIPHARVQAKVDDGAAFVAR
jgi:hypothetical protein